MSEGGEGARSIGARRIEECHVTGERQILFVFGGDSRTVFGQRSPGDRQHPQPLFAMTLEAGQQSPEAGCSSDFPALAFPADPDLVDVLAEVDRERAIVVGIVPRVVENARTEPLQVSGRLCGCRDRFATAQAASLLSLSCTAPGS